MERKSIKTALISVFNKDGIDEIAKELNKKNVQIISTGGTKKHIENLGIKVNAVEDYTNYPAILGGRVKTLHPKIFGGVLGRTDDNDDLEEMLKYEIPKIDLVIVDLYPFEDTLKQTTNENEIIEKIDIGGISLIRAAAKNYNDVLIIPSKKYYSNLLRIIKEANCQTILEERKIYAKAAFDISSHYDIQIFNYFSDNFLEKLKISNQQSMELRYGENPHQKGKFFGDFNKMFDHLHGKKISYNNLLDISAAIDLISEFDELTLAILKHNNPCGLASRSSLKQAWKDALAADPLSAFGGIIITNTIVDLETAQEINKIFYEVIIAPEYSEDALKELKRKKNRIILVIKDKKTASYQVKTVLNGFLVQEKDKKIVSEDDFKFVTKRKPEKSEIEDLIFANKIVKNSKSNSIVLAKNKQLVASGVGETSRVDALKHAIEKAKTFDLELKGSVMASDAFFPFADSVELANRQGVEAVIQPGGSIRDKESIDYCDEHYMIMVFTGIRHFKH